MPFVLDVDLYILVGMFYILIYIYSLLGELFCMFVVIVLKSSHVGSTQFHMCLECLSCT